MTKEVMNQIAICLLGGSLGLLAAAFLLGGLVIGLRFVWLLFKGLWEDLNDHN